MPSIQRKISYGFYAFVAIIALLAIVAFSDLRYLERRIDSGVAVYEFFDTVLRIRLQEKKFFISRTVQNLQSAIDHAVIAQNTLARNRQAFLILQTDTELRKIEKLLHNYVKGLTGYQKLITEGEILHQDSQDFIHRSGDQLSGFAESLATAERTELAASVTRSQWALLSSFVFISILSIAGARLLSNISLRPLAWLQSEFSAIGDGRYNQLEPVTEDREIITMSRAANRMLNDIEVRNRHLMQSEKLVSLGTLVSGVAHELNNPLSNISSSCQIIIEELAQNSFANPMEWLEQIDEETERARLIVQSVLEFSKENRAKKTLVDLHKIISSSLLLIGQMNNKEIKTGKVPQEATLLADGQKLQQVFINLFRNAIDAGGPGVRIAVSVEKMTGKDFKIPAGAVTGKRCCTMDRDSPVQVIEVEDNGPGVSPEVLRRIFDPFFSTKDVGRGDGLGLYITQEIIDLHGGCIAATSQLGAGTRFIICLPCDEHKSSSSAPECR